jgi:magnesium-transporting ATPase (P-type)
VEEAEFEAWFKEWKAACASMQHREEAMGKVAESIEQGLVVVGATAIEDKLQVRWRVE